MCVVALKFFEPFGACNTSLLGTGKFDLPLKSTLPTSVLAKSDEGLEGNGFTESTTALIIVSPKANLLTYSSDQLVSLASLLIGTPL